MGEGIICGALWLNKDGGLIFLTVIAKLDHQLDPSGKREPQPRNPLYGLTCRCVSEAFS